MDNGINKGIFDFSPFDHQGETKAVPTQEESDSSSDSEGENDLPDSLRPSLERQGSSELQYAWEQKIVDDTLMRRSPIIKAAIFGLDGALKAWAPPNFTPDNQVIQVCRHDNQVVG